MSLLEPITRKSAESLALDRLREAILMGGLAAGARLTETALADQLATSRATVRTALHHLVAEGLAVQVPYTGWMVTSLTANDAWELVTLRASLESLAASLDAAFEKLAISASSRKPAAATTADFAFHRAIIVAAAHERLVEHYRRVSQQISILIASSNALMSDPSHLVDQHAPIYRAIITGKADTAATLARRHIEDEGAKLIAHLHATEASTQKPALKRKEATS
jgi:DNA-binding GntR family transcriptional regulator